MKNLKFKVHSPEHSKAIQKRLFELGYGWTGCGGEVLHTHSRSVFTYANKKNITAGYSDIVDSSTHPNIKATLDDLYNPDFIKDEQENKLRELDNLFNKFKKEFEQLRKEL